MITKTERKYILETVGNKIITERIIEYINRNKDCVGYEVFKNENGSLDMRKHIFKCLFVENWTKDQFLRYLPFFYYEEKEAEEVDDDPESLFFEMPEKSFAYILRCVKNEWECQNFSDENDNQPDYNDLKNELANSGSILLNYYDFLILKAKRTCKDVIDYIFDHLDVNFGIDLSSRLEEWGHYLQLCEINGKDDWFPNDLDYSLRMLQELAGEEIELIQPATELTRKGTSLSFYFYHIPVDLDGKPVLRWLGIKTSGDEEIYVEHYEADDFHSANEALIIKVLPDTRVLQFNNQKKTWDTIFTGPRNINVDFSIIKKKRNELSLTQDEVSKAINVSSRTYQKWESGEVAGISGFFLLRLMRYLNIKIDEITIDEGK